MKVVHVHRISGVGGSERHLITLLAGLATRGVDVSFVGIDDPRGEPETFYAALDVPFTRIRSRNGLSRRVVPELRHARADLIHTHLVHADLHGPLGGATLVSTKHNDDRFRTGVFRVVERALTRRATRVICITDALRQFNVERVGLPEEKLDVVHYGLDAIPPPWGSNPADDVPFGARILLAISRLVPQKGIDVAIDALPHISDAVLVVLGEGPERAALEEQARGRGVGDRVFLLGRAGNVAPWLRRAEIFVHPARWEGFGLVVLEAMLASLPVVASRVSSLPEVVADGETGLLVAADRPDAFAAVVNRLLADRELARRLGEAGLHRARGEFSVAQMVDRTIAVYEKALRTTASAHDSTE